MAITLQQFALDKLPPDERRELAELLWDSVEIDPESIPDWHIEVLKQRLKTTDEPGIPWDTVKARLLEDAS